MTDLRLISRRKGYQTAPHATQENISEAIAEGANIIRFQIHETSQNVEAWKLSVQSQLIHLSSLVIPVQVVIDLHNCPGALHDNTLQDNLKWFWALAFSIFESRCVFGVLNEPTFTVTDTASIMREMYFFIRSLSRKVIIAISTATGSPENIKGMKVYADPNVWYEIHMYSPMTFTHQGVHQYPLGKTYPTLRNNKLTMRFNLRHVYNFVKKNPNAQIFVGEFSCIRYADPVSRAAYVRECIVQFQRLKAHWCFHAWREWEGWQPEGQTLEVLRNNMR